MAENYGIDVNQRNCGINMTKQNRMSGVRLEQNGVLDLNIQDMCLCQKKVFFLGKKSGLFVYDVLEGKTTFLGQVEENDDNQPVYQICFPYDYLV